MKKVLAVAYDFPPRRTSGVYRPSGLSKYLMRYGWQPTVLTVAPEEGGLVDQSLAARVPSGVRVVRTRQLSLSRWEGPATSIVRSMGILNNSAGNNHRTKLDYRIRQVAQVIQSLLYFPDKMIGWVPGALIEAIELMMAERFDVVYTTSPPQSAPIVGLFLKSLFGIPWVAEFRDPWLHPPEFRALFGLVDPPLRMKLESWLNVLMLNQAEIVLSVTRGHAEELRRLYRLPECKLAVISNGFDEDDFHADGIEAGHPLERRSLTFTHFGTIYPHFGGSFFAALEEVVHECPEIKSRLRINIIGFPDEDVLEYARRDSLKEIVSIRSFINHVDALETMRQSDCLLLFYGNPYISRVCIPGKVYEYLRAGRPILAVTTEGGLKELVEGAQAGWVVHPDDKAEIKRVLKMLVGNEPGNQLTRVARPEFVARFRYDRLAGELAEIFDGALGDGR